MFAESWQSVDVTTERELRWAGPTLQGRNRFRNRSKVIARLRNRNRRVSPSRTVEWPITETGICMKVFWRKLNAVLCYIGHQLVVLTPASWPAWLAGVAYTALFALLLLITEFAQLPHGVAAGCGFAIWMVAASLGMVVFQRDRERRDAIRGIREDAKELEYVRAATFGQSDDPLTEIKDRYPKRLGWWTLLASGLGMVLGYSLLCRGLFHAIPGGGLFAIPSGVESKDLGPWLSYSVRNVVSALDVFDTVTVAGGDKLSTADVLGNILLFLGIDKSTVERLQQGLQQFCKEYRFWETFGYPPMQHQGWMKGGTWLFRGVFDLMLLAKVRELVTSWGLYRSIRSRTEDLPPPERRDLIVRNVASAFREIGPFFANSYIAAFLQPKPMTLWRMLCLPVTFPILLWQGMMRILSRKTDADALNSRVFAGLTVAYAGPESRQYALSLIGILDELKAKGGRDADIKALMTALGRLEIDPNTLDYPMKAGGAAQKLPEPGIGVTWTCEEFQIEFCGIPAGEFKMGTNLARLKDEDTKKALSDEEQHPVRISQGFYLAKTPVTQRQFMELTGFNPSYFRDDDVPDARSRPVEQVSWPEAQAFCTWLTILERGEGRLPPGWIYRLPTEAEWEYACRAGDDDILVYQDINKRAWHSDNSGSKTHIVADRLANDWGLYDMLGNVNEWTVDWHSNEIPTELAIDPVGPRSGSARVFRGGGCALPAGSCRPAVRRGLAPSYRDSILGFRLALSFVGVPGKPGKENK